MSTTLLFVRTVAFDPTGSRLFCLRADGSGALFALCSGQLQFEAETPRAPVTAVRDPQEKGAGSLVFLEAGVFVVDQLGSVYFASFPIAKWQRVITAPYASHTVMSAGGGVIAAAHQRPGLPSPAPKDTVLQIAKAGKTARVSLGEGAIVHAVHAKSDSVVVITNESVFVFRPDGGLIERRPLPDGEGPVVAARFVGDTTIFVRGDEMTSVVARHATLDLPPVCQIALATPAWTISRCGAVAPFGSKGLSVAASQLSATTVEQWERDGVVTLRATANAGFGTLALSPDGRRLFGSGAPGDGPLCADVDALGTLAAPIGFVREMNPRPKLASPATITARKVALGRLVDRPFSFEFEGGEEPGLAFHHGIDPTDRRWLAWPDLANVSTLTIRGDELAFEEGVFDELVETLASCPALRQLEGLSLGGNGLSPRGVTALSKGFSRLRSLRLEWEAVREAGLSAIACATAFPLLEELTLDFTMAGEPLDALADAPFRPTLRKLSLRGNDLDARAIERAFSVPWPKLEVLDFGRSHDVNRLGDAGAKILAGVDLPSVQHLDLESTGIGAGGVRALAKAKWRKQLLSIVLANNPLGAKGEAAAEKAFGKKLAWSE